LARVYYGISRKSIRNPYMRLARALERVFYDE